MQDGYLIADLSTQAFYALSVFQEQIKGYDVNVSNYLMRRLTPLLDCRTQLLVGSIDEHAEGGRPSAVLQVSAGFFDSVAPTLWMTLKLLYYQVRS